MKPNDEKEVAEINDVSFAMEPTLYSLTVLSLRTKVSVFGGSACFFNGEHMQRVFLVKFDGVCG